MVNANQNGKAVFQVKSGSVNRATIATLNSDRLREKATFGYLIIMETPTKPMLKEAQGIGKYNHPLLAREDDCIKIITIQEILEGARMDLPMSRDAVKTAQAAGDTERQRTLI